MNSSASRILGVALAVYAAMTLVSMAAMNLAAFALVLVLVWVFKGAFRRGVQEVLRLPPVRRYLLAAAVLSVALVLSLLAAQIWPVVYGDQRIPVQLLKGLGKIWHFFWPLILVLALLKTDERGRRLALKSWLITFGVLSCLGLVQYFVGWPRPQMIPGNEPYFHATLFLGHHLSVASIFIFPFFFALDYLLKRFSETRPLALFWLGILVVLGVAVLFATYSRMLWLALPVGLFLWGLLRLPGRWKAVAVLVVALLVGGAWQQPQVQKRMTDSLGVGDRFALWEANFQFFKDRPLTGTGWRLNESASGLYLSAKQGVTHVFAGHAHNNLLDVLGGMGAVGLIAWFFWWGVIFWLLFEGRGLADFSRVPGVGILCALLVFHLNGLTQVNIWEAKVQHQLSWVVAWLLCERILLKRKDSLS